MAVTIEEFRKTTTIVYFSLMVPFCILGWCLYFTSTRKSKEYLVFRTKGMTYIQLYMIGCLLVEPILGITQVVSLHFVVPYLFRLIILSLQRSLLFFILGLLLGRQIVLALIFHTIRVRRNFISFGLLTIITPCLITFLWLLICEVPIWYSYLTSNSLSNSTTSTTSYTYSAIAILAFCFFCICNRKIPIKLYTDFVTNILTMVFLMLAAIVWGVVVSVTDTSLVTWEMFTVGVNTVGVMFCCHCAINFLLLRSCVAVWFQDKEYLEKSESVLKNYRMYVSSDNKQTSNSLSSNHKRDDMSDAVIISG